MSLSPEYEAVALATAKLNETRHQAEVRLLATIAPIGRWGLALARRAAIEARHFSGDDTRAIMHALLTAETHGDIIDRTRTAKLIRCALRAARYWDDSDGRAYAHGSMWGPGAIAALVCRVDRCHAEQAIPILAAGLLRLEAECCALTCRAESEAV